MNNYASSGILSVFLIPILLIGTAAVSNEILSENDTNEIYNINNYDELINDTLNEISTYFNIKHILGKYYNNENIYYIGKIVILLKPYFDINFDLSNLNILLSNEEKVVILQNNDKTEFTGSYDVFEHPNWDRLSYGFYGILVVSDQDNSIEEFNIINDNTDLIYITLNISDYFNFEKGDNIKISLIPSSGNSQTFLLKAPLPTNKIVNLYWRKIILWVNSNVFMNPLNSIFLRITIFKKRLVYYVFNNLMSNTYYAVLEGNKFHKFIINFYYCLYVKVMLT